MQINDSSYKKIENILIVQELPVLFSHSCRTPTAHPLHIKLLPYFKEKNLNLLLDPFIVGEDVIVAMHRLNLNAVVFYVTTESITSDACKIEIDTAKRINAPILVITDGTQVPKKFQNRIFLNLFNLTNSTHDQIFKELALQIQVRARIHAIINWLKMPERTVEEREYGIMWLYSQHSQILAEFLKQIASLYHENEDNIVCHWLAQVLARTELPEACLYLQQWWAQNDHPFARNGLNHAMQLLGCKSP